MGNCGNDCVCIANRHGRLAPVRPEHIVVTPPLLGSSCTVAAYSGSQYSSEQLRGSMFSVLTNVHATCV